jgi:hypothetical protein
MRKEMKMPSFVARPLVVHALIASILSASSLGCDEKSPSASPSASATTALPGASATAAASDAPVASAAPGMPAASTEALATPIDVLFGRLAREAHDRPVVSPTSDEVLDALGRLGAVIPKREQSLGDTYKANYCLGGYTEDGAFTLSACEYADAAAATAGRELSKKILAKMPTRDVWNHKSDTLAIVQLKADEATTARKKKLVAAFLAM